MIPAQLPTISPLSIDVAGSSIKASAGASSVFGESLKKVDQQLKKSSELKERYALGDPNVTLPEVMIESQKSKLAMATTIEIRNKALEAYRDLINMPV